MTEKQIEACRSTVKMYQWLAAHKGKYEEDYFGQFPEEQKELDRLGFAANVCECFLCGAFDCRCDCPLVDCGHDSLYGKLVHTECPVYAFLIADTAERALKEVMGSVTTKNVCINKGGKE